MRFSTRSVAAAGAVAVAALAVPVAVSSAVSDASDRVTLRTVTPAVEAPEWASDPVPVWPLETPVEAPPVTAWNAPIPTWSVPDLTPVQEGTRRPVLTDQGRSTPLD